MDWQKQFEILKHGTIEITPEDEFKQMLKKSSEENKPLRVKCGIDPTNSDIHLGHLVPYRKMRAFQDLGHIGVVIIGDYTAQIGDPTGKNESRPSLTAEDTKKNAEKYMDQVFTVLDPDKTEIRYQSEWFGKKTLADSISWMKETTVAKLLSHDTFKNRLDQGQSLGLHELFYPVLQGMDSAFIDADIELGGSDQKFNVLMGRDYQKHRKMRPQVAMLLPIVTGLDGQQKMSKSLNNYIGVFDEPFDMFGKVMSIPDALMEEYMIYLSGKKIEQIEKFCSGLRSGKSHPNEAKKELASEIVGFFHGQKTGLEMRSKFEDVFKNKGLPEDIPEYKLSGEMGILNLLTEAGVVKSNGEARRLVVQNAIQFIDGDKISDPKFVLNTQHKEQVLKIGKRRFLKIV